MRQRTILTSRPCDESKSGRTIKGVAKSPRQRRFRLCPWLNKPGATFDVLLTGFQSFSEWICVLCLQLGSLERRRRVEIFPRVGETHRVERGDDPFAKQAAARQAREAEKQRSFPRAGRGSPRPCPWDGKMPSLVSVLADAWLMRRIVSAVVARGWHLMAASCRGRLARRA
jgi:hypothetical protein